MFLMADLAVAGASIASAMAVSGLPRAPLGHHKKAPRGVLGSIAGQIGALGLGGKVGAP